jgi:hypothetical protein
MYCQQQKDKRRYHILAEKRNTVILEDVKINILPHPLIKLDKSLTYFISPYQEADGSLTVSLVSISNPKELKGFIWHGEYIDCQGSKCCESFNLDTISCLSCKGIEKDDKRIADSIDYYFTCEELDEVKDKKEKIVKLYSKDEINKIKKRCVEEKYEQIEMLINNLIFLEGIDRDKVIKNISTHY